jgi:hypothetical protein
VADALVLDASSRLHGTEWVAEVYAARCDQPASTALPVGSTTYQTPPWP